MPKIQEKSLIIKKETHFDKIRKMLYQIFFKEAYFIEMQLEELTQIKRPNPQKIIIPKEIKKFKD